MIVWTVQPKTALEDIEKTGSFRCDEKLDKFLDKLYEMPVEEQRRIIADSRNNVFLIDRLETENFTRVMYVQATFWEKRIY